MSTLAQDIDKTVKVTAMSDSDLIPIVRNGTLMGITFADFKRSLGVTGQIKSIGTGTALLTKPSSTVNYIGAIKAGTGITVTTAPDGAVQIGLA